MISIGVCFTYYWSCLLLFFFRDFFVFVCFYSLLCVCLFAVLIYLYVCVLCVCGFLWDFIFMQVLLFFCFFFPYFFSVFVFFFCGLLLTSSYLFIYIYIFLQSFFPLLIFLLSILYEIVLFTWKLEHLYNMILSASILIFFNTIILLLIYFVNKILLKTFQMINVT